jgi:drug/metabolite transporter (DMT)-like permease
MTQAPLAVVAALRETSILFGALLAFLMLKEKVAGLRIVAACGIAAGLFCCACPDHAGNKCCRWLFTNPAWRRSSF